MKKKKNKYDQVIAGVVMSALSIGVIIAGQSIRSTLASSSGTPVDIATMNAQEYQVNDLYLLEDGNYVVHGTAKGFASDIEVAVTFDNVGDKILSLSVVSQGETDGIGSKITEEEFLNRFKDIQAPIKIGNLEIVSPSGSVILASSDNSNEANMAAETYSSMDWNKEDQSPEAVTMRTLYDAGLLSSSKNGEQLDTAFADLSAEEKASEKLKESNLLASSKQEEAGQTIQEATTIDAISGATVSSETVGKIVNNSYFFLKENIIN